MLRSKSFDPDNLEWAVESAEKNVRNHGKPKIRCPNCGEDKPCS